ncbi:MAG: RNA-directed DNA polymerase [Prolixibacteraceae bacterium]|nr:RNA-directed DNA polymerase [Prolixibacteraceae bacterium]
MAIKAKPTLKALCNKYLLIQAWKKTASYIRYHNWYSDILDLDLNTIDLPFFIDTIYESILTWETDPLLMIPAPKSQEWAIKNKLWNPTDKITGDNRIRPLAHVSLRDQVLSTALLICMADIVENRQGNPNLPFTNDVNRKKVISYGNRLYCKEQKGKIHYNWGSIKLYRSYYQDYQNFLKRPDVVIQELKQNRNPEKKIILIYTDLSKFYDRVSTDLLHDKISSVLGNKANDRFIDVATNILTWKWDDKGFNKQLVEEYRTTSNIGSLDKVALPQGLVASGFFSNLVLLDFDDALKSSIGTELSKGIALIDTCRYVDDMRFVLNVDNCISDNLIQKKFTKWLTNKLDCCCPGLKLSEEKTIIINIDSDDRLLVKQSRKMQKLQKEISGGFDVKEGFEIIDALQGLMRAQMRFNEGRIVESNKFTAIPDVKDETVARFAANRFRSSYRSLRTMLFDDFELCDKCPQKEHKTDHLESESKLTLDEDAKVFSFGLIENWICNPANVRLLRIALDLWPDKGMIENVLELLDQHTISKVTVANTSNTKQQTNNKNNFFTDYVAWYCMAEIFKAAATETGITDNSEDLPDVVDFEGFRKALIDEGVSILSLRSSLVPWYVQQQVLLFLIVVKPDCIHVNNDVSKPELGNYYRYVSFIQQEEFISTDIDFAKFVLLVKQSSDHWSRIRPYVFNKLTKNVINEIVQRNPSFGIELLKEISQSKDMEGFSKIYDSLNNASESSLYNLVVNDKSFIVDEKSLINFSLLFLGEYQKIPIANCKSIPPTAIEVEMEKDKPDFGKVSININQCNIEGSLYDPPSWVSKTYYWRYNLGYLIRFLLTRNYDYSLNKYRSHESTRIPVYRRPENHWLQRDYGMFNGFQSFGADWLPISEWIEQLLFSLLQWPGCNESNFIIQFDTPLIGAIKELEQRKQYLDKKYGVISSTLMIPLRVNSLQDKPVDNSYRACIVQKVLPDEHCFTNDDLSLSSHNRRSCQKKHLASSLAALKKMLDLRETHLPYNRKLDLLIFPELSIHPDDVITHLVPFVRAYKTMIIAGMCYSDPDNRGKLINSALWIIPQVNSSGNFQMIIRRQGKKNLSFIEKAEYQNKLIGFRPCQWIVEYYWHKKDKPLKMSASICYDATDIKLAADLRNKSDIFIIPAFNQDISTFDNMALALHYHMYQMVIIANNGTYGGSCAFMPLQEHYKREIFHLHGQPQASIAFFEIEDLNAFLNRYEDTCNSLSHKDRFNHKKSSCYTWKTPPAGIEPN